MRKFSLFKAKFKSKVDSNQKALNSFLSKSKSLEWNSELYNLPETLKSFIALAPKIKDPYSLMSQELLKNTLTAAEATTRFLTTQTYLPFSSTSPDSLAEALIETKKELRSVKGILLSSRNFPSAST